MYLCLTGRPAFENSLAQRQTVRPIAPKELDATISSNTSKLVMRLLDNEPQKRCNTMDDLFKEISQLRERFEKISLLHRNFVGRAEILVSICVVAFVFYLTLYSIPKTKDPTSSVVQTPPPTYSPKGSDIYKKCAPAVLLVKAENMVGSGVIIQHRDRKLILTNAHVVRNVLHAEVITKTGESYRTKVLYPDKLTDLALVALPKKLRNAAVIPMGTIKQTTVGDDVYVIGHPKGYNWSLTRGTVSGIRDYKIQTDAAINPGNSGGPLLNKQGKMIGITTFIVDKSNNIGLAISVDRVIEFLELFFRYPHAQRMLEEEQ